MSRSHFHSHSTNKQAKKKIARDENKWNKNTKHNDNYSYHLTENPIHISPLPKSPVSCDKFTKPTSQVLKWIKKRTEHCHGWSPGSGYLVITWHCCPRRHFSSTWEPEQVWAVPGTPDRVEVPMATHTHKGKFIINLLSLQWSRNAVFQIKLIQSLHLLYEASCLHQSYTHGGYCSYNY